MTNDSNRMSRRTALKALGSAGALSATAGCINNPFGKSEFQKQLDTIREQIKDYDGAPKAALKDGYKQITGPFIPGMGWHFMHPKNLQDAAKNGFSIDKPQSLYFDQEFNLGGAEWAAPAGQVPASPDLFKDENAEAAEKWTKHNKSTHIFATPDDAVQKPPEITFDQWTTPTNWVEIEATEEYAIGDTATLNWGGVEKEERVIDVVATHPGLRTCHVWVMVDNPNGVFNPTNPDFADGSGGKHH